MKAMIILCCSMGALHLWAARSEPISVDFSANGGRIVSSSANVGYGPDWAVATNATGVTADLLLVTHVGEVCVSTQTLASAASVSGVCSLTPFAVNASSCRLILRTKSGETILGELVRDVSFGIASSPSALTRIDMAEDKLNRALLAGETPSIAYAEWWTNGVASLRIDLEGRRKDGSPVQRRLFAVTAPADGAFAWSTPLTVKGDYELKLKFHDSSENIIDTLTVAYAGFTGLGFTLMLQ